jgi:hypothetical protein
MISGFGRDANEICALLGYNAASSGNPLPGVPLDAALYPRRAQISSYTQFPHKVMATDFTRS